MPSIFVWLRMPNGSRIRAGELRYDQRRGPRGVELHSEFRYEHEYLNDNRAIPLNPANLPLKDTTYPDNNALSGLHGVFEDSLPDAWGRALLAKKLKLPVSASIWPQLMLYLGTNCLGALAYTPSRKWSSPHQTPPLLKLSELLDASEAFESSPNAVDSHYADLLQAGSSPGGARPKAIVHDQNGTEWLVKFPSTKDDRDVVGLEATSMHIARACGIPIPDFMIKSLPNGRRIFMIQRFDVSPSGGRYHVLSAQSLMGLSGYYYTSYLEVLRALQQYASTPQATAEKFLRQATLNFLLGNTDDHLKNFSFMCGPNGWDLSPAYDILPNILGNPEHVLQVNYSYSSPSLRAAIDLYGAAAISSSRAIAIVEEMKTQVMKFAEVAETYGVPEPDRAHFQVIIEKRLTSASWK